MSKIGSVMSFEELQEYFQSKKNELVGLQGLENSIKAIAHVIKEGGERIKGIVFEGLPGVGKTLVAQYVAYIMGEEYGNSTFIYVTGGDLKANQILGVNNPLKLFKEAERLTKNDDSKIVVVFIDEIDAIALAREGMGGSGTSNASTVLQDLLNVLDNAKSESRTRVVVLCATNVYKQLDPAIKRPGRFDKFLTFTKPDENKRYELITYLANKHKIDTSNIDLDSVVGMTSNFSHADIAGLMRNLKNEMTRLIKVENTSINTTVVTRLFAEIIKDMKYGKLVYPLNVSPDVNKMITAHVCGHAIPYLLLSPDLYIMSPLDTGSEFSCSPTLVSKTYANLEVKNVKDIILEIMSCISSKKGEQLINSGQASTISHTDSKKSKELCKVLVEIVSSKDLSKKDIIIRTNLVLSYFDEYLNKFYTNKYFNHKFAEVLSIISNHRNLSKYDIVRIGEVIAQDCQKHGDPYYVSIKNVVSDVTKIIRGGKKRDLKAMQNPSGIDMQVISENNKESFKSEADIKDSETKAAAQLEISSNTKVPAAA